MKKQLKQAAAAALSGIMLLSGLAIWPDSALTVFGADCVIDTGKTHQYIRGFGGMNHPEWQSVNTQYGAKGDMTAEQVQTAFGNGENELGLTILRIFVSDDKNAWGNAIPTAKRAQALGATVFATPWNPPASMRSAGGKGHTSGLYVLNNGAEAQYAQHLNSFVKYCEGQGVNLYSISVQNEPDWSSEWTYWSPDRATNFIANYGKAVKEGTNAKLMSPESFQYSSGDHGKTYYKKILANSAAFANCDLFGTHFYGTQRSQMDFPELESCGKEIWMTEVYVPNSDANSADIWSQALQAAENIHNAMVVGNMSAYVWWYIRRQYSFLWDDGRVSKRGAAMAQYSKWVRPGAYRLETTEQPTGNVLCSAYKNEDGSVAVVAINKGTNPVTQSFTLSGGEKVSEVNAWHSTSTENFRSCSVASVNDSGFTAQLPAQSVTTFVVSAGEPEPDPDGYLFHYTFEKGTDGFTGRTASVAATTSEHYAGNQALECTDRTATWNGATHTMPSAFKAGQTYSFSAVVKQNSSDVEKMHFSVQYSNGETTVYDKIDTQLVPKGEWTQLSNTSYTIPAGASNIQFYFETDGDEGTTTSFYVDEVIGAPEGKVIDGPHPDVPEPKNYKLGDPTGDGIITAADLSAAKLVAKGLITDASIKKFSDVDASGTVDADDLDWFVKYLTGQIKDLPEAKEQPQAAMRSISVYTAAVKNSLVEYEPESERSQKAGVKYPEIKKETYFSKKANKNKPYNIMLPANYDPNKKYPVLYLLHGYYEDEDRMILKGNNPPIPTREIITNAIAAGEAKEMIVVVPFVFTSATMNGPSGMNNESNAAYDAFVDDIVDSLMPHIESKYSVATGRANTAVTGFSMGGRESLLIGIKHADKFGYVGAICAAPGVTGPWKWSSEEAAPSLILITGGTNDQTVGLQTPEGYHKNFDSAGTPHLWHVVNGGYHGDNCIRAHVYNFVRMIFKA